MVQLLGVCDKVIQKWSELFFCQYKNPQQQQEVWDGEEGVDGEGGREGGEAKCKVKTKKP